MAKIYKIKNCFANCPFLKDGGYYCSIKFNNYKEAKDAGETAGNFDEILKKIFPNCPLEDEV